MNKVYLSGLFRILITVLMLFGTVFSSTAMAATSATSNVTTAICSVYFIVNDAVFILALTLMVLGGAIYSGGQLMPGSSRGQIQAYAMGLVFGGTVGAIIAMLAPWLLGQIFGTSASSISTFCPGF